MTKNRNPSVNDRLLEVLGSMKRWDDLSKTVTGPLPGEIAAAIASGRPELAHLAVPRALTEEECKSCFDLIYTLLETNAALQLHAQLLAQKTQQWSEGFKGIVKHSQDIEDFAHFREPVEE